MVAKRVSPDDLRSYVSFALLNIDRPDLLDDSPLIEILDIRASGFWGQGKALRERMLEATPVVSHGLADVSSLLEKKDLLDQVLQGKSLSQWAREHGKSREHVTKRLWKEVCEWVGEELEASRVVSSRKEA